MSFMLERLGIPYPNLGCLFECLELENVVLTCFCVTFVLRDLQF